MVSSVYFFKMRECRLFFWKFWTTSLFIWKILYCFIKNGVLISKTIKNITIVIILVLALFLANKLIDIIYTAIYILYSFKIFGNMWCEKSNVIECFIWTKMYIYGFWKIEDLYQTNFQKATSRFLKHLYINRRNSRIPSNMRVILINILSTITLKNLQIIR